LYSTDVPSIFVWSYLDSLSRVKHHLTSRLQELTMMLEEDDVVKEEVEKRPRHSCARALPKA
jgi:hypothetical protein